AALPPASPAPEAAPSPHPIPVPGAPAAEAFSRTRPVVPAPLAEYFLPHTRTLAEATRAAGRNEALPQARLVYHPGLLAQARVRFFDRKTGVDEERRFAALVPDPQRRGILRWEEFPLGALDPATLPAGPQAGAAFANLDPLLADGKATAALQKEFVDYLYRSAALTLLSNPALKLTAPPGVSTAGFKQQCADAAREARDAGAAKEAARYDAKLKALRDKLAAEERDLAESEEELSARKREQNLTDMENVLGFFGGRRRSLRRGLSTSASKRRLTEKAHAGVGESRALIAQHREDLAALEAEKARAIQAITDRWAATVEEVRELRLTPLKKDIAVELFGVAWQPFWVTELGGKTVELPA
ncbi:MAG: hypothetical protein HY784_05955, partial [Chloroflexi bacterium]|nr:hypothetical protein [Chloroflexota bacterium]